MVLEGCGALFKFSAIDFICFNPSRLFNFNENLLLVKHVLYKSKVTTQKQEEKKKKKKRSLHLLGSFSLTLVLQFFLCFSRVLALSLVLCVIGESLLASCRFIEW